MVGDVPESSDSRPTPPGSSNCRCSLEALQSEKMLNYVYIAAYMDTL